MKPVPDELFYLGFVKIGHFHIGKALEPAVVRRHPATDDKLVFAVFVRKILYFLNNAVLVGLLAYFVQAVEQHYAVAVAQHPLHKRPRFLEPANVELLHDEIHQRLFPVGPLAQGHKHG